MFEAILWVLGEGLNLVKLLVTLYTVFFIILYEIASAILMKTNSNLILKKLHKPHFVHVFSTPSQLKIFSCIAIIHHFVIFS